MLKVVTKTNYNEVWGTWPSELSRKSLQEKIDTWYFHKYMYKEDKNKSLIIITWN